MRSLILFFKILCVQAFISALVFPVLPAAADTVYMADGSVIHGDMVKMSAQDGVKVKTDFAGMLDIASASIQGVSTDNMFVNELKSGDRILGMLQFSPEGGQQILSNRMGNIAVNFADLKNVWDHAEDDPYLQSKEAALAQAQKQLAEQQEAHEQEIEKIKEDNLNSGKKVWSGKIRAGFSGSSGNTDQTSFDGKVSAERKTDFDRLSMSWQGIFETDNGQQTKNEMTGELGLERDITDRLFTFGNLKLERDKFEDLDIRADMTGGFGYFLIKEEHQELKPRLGLGYEVAAYKNSPNTEDVVLSAGYDYRLDLFDRMRFTHAFTYLPRIEDIGGDYRIDSDATLAVPIHGESKWNLEFNLKNQYASKPAVNVDNLDTYYSIGVSRDFE